MIIFPAIKNIEAIILLFTCLLNSGVNIMPRYHRLTNNISVHIFGNIITGNLLVAIVNIRIVVERSTAPHKTYLRWQRRWFLQLAAVVTQ
jgi:hypothetical protein